MTSVLTLSAYAYQEGVPLVLAFTAIFNASRHPAMSIPCGLSKSGLPIGVQIVAGHYRDGLLMRVAAAFEAECGFPALPIG